MGGETILIVMSYFSMWILYYIVTLKKVTKTFRLCINRGMK